jgi:hypothetical protein
MNLNRESASGYATEPWKIAGKQRLSTETNRRNVEKSAQIPLGQPVRSPHLTEMSGRGSFV